MKLPFPGSVTTESVFVWLIHRIAEEFKEHAILKGGMSLRLLDCPRATNDLDYTFVPYKSKKDIIKGIDGILSEIPGAKIEKRMSSKSLKITIGVGNVNVQIEAGVSLKCKSAVMSTASLARTAGQLGRIIRIMSFDAALSHKLAAWNERRLLRDLYDAYFIYQIIGEKPDMSVLLERLNKVESRIPMFKKIKRMSMGDFIDELERGISWIDGASIERELSPLLAREELAGLDIRLKAALRSLAGYLKSQG